MGIILGTVLSNKSHRSDGFLSECGLEFSDSDIYSRKNIFFCGKSPDLINGDNTQYTYYDNENECCIVAHARLDYKHELKKHLGFSDVQPVSDGQLILLSYVKWGYECMNHLFGDFAFGIYDFKRDLLFCARDHFGCIPFLYHSSNDRFVFSTHTGIIQNCLSEQKRISDSWISDCLTLVSPDFSQTPFGAIKKLAPAHYLIYKEGEIVSQKYWILKVNETFSNHKDLKAVQTFKGKLFDAIDSRITPDDVVGIELSGGLDSSGIASVASKICFNKQIRVLAFSHVINKNSKGNLFPFKDETKFSTLVCKYSNIENHLLIDGNNKGVLIAIKNGLETLKYPVPQGYSMLSDQLYSEASSRGVNVLFSGFGGDECVTSSASGYFNELAEKRKWKVLKHEIKIKHINWRRKFLKMYIFHLVGRIFPRRYQQLRSKREKQNNTSLVYEMFGLDKDFEEIHRSPKRFSEQTGFPRDPDVKKRQYKRINSNHITMRLENSFYLTEKHGLSYRFPLLDVKLVEYYYSLSNNLKYRDGYGRYIYRKVLEDYLPDEICWRDEKSGSAVPSVQERFLIDVEDINTIINESEYANLFHYVDYDKLRLMVQKVVSRDQGRNTDFAPTILFNHLKILILQKWQREGKIDIGIKC